MQERDDISVVVKYLDKEKSFNVSRRVLESEKGMVKIRAGIEDEFGDDDDEFVDKLDDEIIRIRRYTASDCSVDNDDIIDKLDDMDDNTNEIKFKLKIVNDDEQQQQQQQQQPEQKKEEKDNYNSIDLKHDGIDGYVNWNHYNVSKPQKYAFSKCFDLIGTFVSSQKGESKIAQEQAKRTEMVSTQTDFEGKKKQQDTESPMSCQTSKNQFCWFILDSLCIDHNRNNKIDESYFWTLGNADYLIPQVYTYFASLLFFLLLFCIF